MMAAGSVLSTFRLARSRPELWVSLCAAVWQEADYSATSTTLERKRSGFEVKTSHLALKSVES